MFDMEKRFRNKIIIIIRKLRGMKPGTKHKFNHSSIVITVCTCTKCAVLWTSFKANLVFGDAPSLNPIALAFFARQRQRRGEGGGGGRKRESWLDLA